MRVQRGLAIALLAGAMLVGYGSSWAIGSTQQTTAPDAAGVYTACYDSGGSVKFVSDGTMCPKGWVGPVTWNQQGPKGDPGANGDPGASAYAVAKANGFPGSEAEWLASLVGPNGDSGANAYAVATANGFPGSEADWLASLIGPKGDTGPAGPTGPTGPAGKVDPSLMNASVQVTPGQYGSVTARCALPGWGATGGGFHAGSFAMDTLTVMSSWPAGDNGWQVLAANPTTHFLGLSAFVVCVEGPGN